MLFILLYDIFLILTMKCPQLCLAPDPWPGPTVDWTQMACGFSLRCTSCMETLSRQKCV